ncbi:MAG: PKD domain-containing protein [Bacteroidia bacterium]|nr:PKD domain-containing protein [Bacteroidia bacterium]
MPHHASPAGGLISDTLDHSFCHSGRLFWGTLLACTGWYAAGITLCSGQSFPREEWTYTYDNGGDERPVRMVQLAGGELLLGGNSWFEEGDESCSNIWLVKADTLGQLIWERELGVAGCDELRGLAPTPDGGVVFAGVSNTLTHPDEASSPAYRADLLIGKVDARGTLRWIRHYGGIYTDQAYGIAAGRYDDLVVVGSTHSPHPGDGGSGDIWILRTDESGNVYHQQHIGGAQPDWASAVVTGANGDAILSGVSWSPAPDVVPDAYGNALIARTTRAGHLLWQRVYALPGGSMFSDICEGPDGRLVVAGAVRTSGDMDACWLRLTADGRKIQQSVSGIPGADAFTCVRSAAEDGYLLGGYTTTGAARHPCLLRLDSRGNTLWTGSFLGGGARTCHDVLYYRPGVWFLLADVPHMADPRRRGDFALIRLHELPADSIQAGIFVHTEANRISRETPTRFKAQYKYGERFSWDFGDGTTSAEEQPLKTYTFPGVYQVSLTVYASESCYQTVTLSRNLQVW